MSRPNKLMQRRLDQVKKMTTKAVAAAMNAASEALDARLQEIAALKRILISERAQVIYYTDKYQKFTDGKCFDTVAIGFLSCQNPSRKSSSSKRSRSSRTIRASCRTTRTRSNRSRKRKSS
jgi:hypothetical protein